MSSNRHWEQNKEATVYVGNLDERFTEQLMWELMTQMGPVVNVHMPMDRVSRTHQGFGFVEFDTPESADYAARVMNGVRLFGKPVRINKASADRQRATEIGAELFINNLDPQVDEKILYDTFTQFGSLVSPPNVVRDQNNVSKGYGFVNFDSFEASDAARDAMHGQYLLNKQISVEYAYKKDGKGERHGDEAERKLAAEAKKHNVVPDVQPLPSAFYMTRPQPLTVPALPAPGIAAVPGAMVNGGIGSLSMPPPTGMLTMAPPVGGYVQPPPHGAGPGAPPGFSHQSRQSQQQQPPPQSPYGLPGNNQSSSLPMGFGPPPSSSRGSMPPPPSFSSGPGANGGGSLPMAPSGLPARPPPSGNICAPPVGFGGGNGGQQPQMPPPGFATGANSVGVPGAPGTGYNGMPLPPPPAGFGRR